MGVAVIMLLVLDWAALPDIVKGAEPDWISEYAILVFSVVVFVIWMAWRRGILRIQKKMREGDK